MPSPSIETLIRTHSHMETLRTNYDSQCQVVKDLYWPDAADFTISQTQGGVRSQSVYDSTGVLGLERFGAIWQSLTTPQNTIWQSLKASLEVLNDEPEVKAYFSDLTKVLFRNRNSPRSMFYPQQETDSKSLGAFGGACLRVEPSKTTGLPTYRSIHVGNICVAENYDGIIDTIYYKRPLTAYAAVSMWGDRAPACAKKAIEKNELMEEHEYLHVVQPRDLGQYDPERLDAIGRPFESWEVSLEDKEPISTQSGDESDGYFENPYIYSRFTVNSQEQYGRGPAMWTAPGNLTLQSMKRSTIKQGEKAVSPPLLSHAMQFKGDGRGTLNMRANAMNPGWLDAAGNPRVRAFDNGFRYDIARELMEDERNTLRDSFYVTLFQILVDNPQMTATEAMIRAREKGALIGPPIARQQSERLGPMTLRELGILERLPEGHPNKLPAAPAVLLEAGDEFDVEYESEATTMQREAETSRVRVWMEDVEMIKQVTGDESVGLVVNGHETARWLSDARQIPTEAVTSEREVQAKIKQMQEDQQRAEEAAMVPDQARAAKDLAEAEAA